MRSTAVKAAGVKTGLSEALRGRALRICLFLRGTWSQQIAFG
jgi:hypothetical protein